MSDIVIRPLIKEDIPSVARLEAVCFSMPFTEKALNELFSNTSWHFFVATENDTVVGYISFYCILDETEIVNVCVMPELRGKGIGRALTKCAIDFNRETNGSKVMLEVRKSNTPAIKLYESLGFIPVGVSKNHYKLPTEDAILMNLE
jgi:ribosomal-protein-alanine N-acetyltransferase